MTYITNVNPTVGSGDNLTKSTKQNIKRRIIDFRILLVVLDETEILLDGSISMAMPSKSEHKITDGSAGQLRPSFGCKNVHDLALSLLQIIYHYHLLCLHTALCFS